MGEISLCPEMNEKIADLLLEYKDNVILLYAGTYIKSLENELADLRIQLETYKDYNLKGRKGNIMSKKELQRLYDLLEKITNEDEKAALRHAIHIIESNNHVY